MGSKSSRQKTWSGLVSVALMLGLFQGVQSADAAAFLWIAAPNWSYSAALAQSPAGTAYYWGLSVGAGTFSYAYAFSNAGGGNAAYAFAQASTGRGGRGGWLATGFADPWSGDAVDAPSLDPSNPSSYPPANTDPTTSGYTVTNSGITFTETGEDSTNGDEEVQAFVYNGPTDESDLDTEFGAPADSESGTGSGGDVTGFSPLTSDLSLIPLDAPVDDPNGLGTLAFTENTGDLAGGDSNVILVAEGDVPEPMSASLLAVGALALLARRRRATA